MDSTDLWDLISVPGQGPVKTHGIAMCQGSYCCVHNPSDHHMRDWPLVFDISRMSLGVRLCEHGFPHPDPDSITYFRSRALHVNMIIWLMAHECDGCCLSLPEEGTL